MRTRIVRLPDVGEGVAEAELVAWHVARGDDVTPDTVVAEVLTDKATVEIYAPVAGTVAFVRGNAGDVLAVGSELFGIAVEGDAAADADTGGGHAGDMSTIGTGGAEPASTCDAAVHTDRILPRVDSAPAPADLVEVAAPAPGDRAEAAPAVRARARALGIDLAAVPAASNRVTHEDLDRHLLSGREAGSHRGVGAVASTEVPIVGLRRRIASRMTASLRIPHITYVEEIDVTALEQLRGSLAADHGDARRLTLLPFVMRALVMAVADHPQCNATFDEHADPAMLSVHGAVHLGIATNTPNGLVVPVVRDAQSQSIWQLAGELGRVAGAAREGTLGRDELSGSTITITSLGALGGQMTTPIINHPEVAIVGVNKIAVRPAWDGTGFVPRSMMNLSSSFDHRVIDGWNAAVFVQRIKALLEEPALLVDPPAGTA